MRIRMQRHRESLEFSRRGGLMESTIVYRLEPRLRMLQSAVYLVPALAVIPMLFFARGDRLLPLLLWGALVVIAVVMIVGVHRTRLVLEDTHLTAVGVFRTRVLIRERALGLSVASGIPILGWQNERGAERAWPLLALYVAPMFSRLVPGALHRRQQFIDRVNAWAASALDARS
jgi:hypothetical protein